MVSVIPSLGTVDSAKDLLKLLIEEMIPASEVLELRANSKVGCGGEKFTIIWEAGSHLAPVFGVRVTLVLLCASYPYI